jgi:hypothetical protein
VIFPYPLFNILLQSPRNPDHLLDLAMRDSAADIVAAHVSLLAERIESTDKLPVLSLT